MPSATASPSPPPKPPTALTPGPRAAAFTTLFNSALSSTLKSISYESFASCFPLISSQAPHALRAMHAGLTTRLEGFAKDEFEVIMRERAVVERLNELEDRLAEAKRRKARALDADGDGNADPAVPPHTLPPAPLIAAHLTPLHISQQSQLNAKLQTTASQNATLAEHIQQQRREIDELVRAAQVMVADLEGAGKELEGETGVRGLDGRSREAEVVMSGSEPRTWGV